MGRVDNLDGKVNGNKKQSENAETPTSETFDFGLKPCTSREGEERLGHQID